MISIFAPLAFVLVLSLGVNRLSRPAAQALYWAFCAAMGASLTNIFLIYTSESIVRVFFITAGTFAAMSIYGYTTKADLSRFGSFLIMGLFGIIIAGAGEHLPRQFRAAVRHQRHRRDRVHRPDRLRHAADQGDYVQYAYAEGTGWRGEAQRL